MPLLKDGPGFDGTPEGERTAEGPTGMAELAGARLRAATSLADPGRTEADPDPVGRTVAVMVSSGSQVSSVAVALLLLMAAPRAPREKSTRAAKAPAFLNNMMSSVVDLGINE